MAKILGREDEALIFQELECNLLGRDFIPPLASVHVDGPHGVDWETLVRIDGDAEKTRVGIDKLVLIPNHGVPQNTSITQVCQSRHVIGAIELWRVYLCNLILLENFGLLYEKIQ